MTADLLRMRDWLKERGATHVAMESTGSFWKPIFNILEGHLEVLVVNAQHLKAVAFAEDRHQRCRMDRRFASTRAAATQLCSPGFPTRTARTDPLPHESGGRALAHHQPTPEAALRCQHQTGVRSKRSDGQIGT